jgi:RNA polymerase sigma-70 factor (ECF subfamily)
MDMLAPSSLALCAQPWLPLPQLIVVPEALALAGEPANAPDSAPEPLAPESGRLRRPSVAGSTDEELVLAACAGDLRATTIIWRRYSAQVRAKMHHWIGPQDIDDHVQEVFSRLFAQLPRVRQPSALRGFIIGITLRVSFTELRRRRRCRLRLTATGELPEPREVSLAFGDCGPDREALWRFEAILGALSPASRRVFVLRYVDKLELVDVAAEMGISLATVKRHLARAAGHVAAMVDREPALADYVRDGGHDRSMRFGTGADPRSSLSAS